MMMRGHKLKKTKFFAFAHDDTNLFLKYGYTGFQWTTLMLSKRWSSACVKGRVVGYAHQRQASCVQPHQRHTVR
jgi:hypothetical protein